MTRHIAFSAVCRYDEDMTDARSFPSDTKPARDEAQLELRASDADRDAAAAVLSGALATGRLTSTEHAERLERRLCRQDPRRACPDHP